MLSLEDLDVLTENGAICDEDGHVGRVQVLVNCNVVSMRRTPATRQPCASGVAGSTVLLPHGRGQPFFHCPDQLEAVKKRGQGLI